MISAAAADWRAAGSGGADCDPKDVAGMVEDYVIEKKEDASSQQKKKKKPSHPLLNTTELADMGCFFWHTHQDENEQLLMHCKQIAHFCFNNRCNELQQQQQNQMHLIWKICIQYIYVHQEANQLINH